MPVFAATIWGGLVSIIGSLAGRVMLALGLGVITYIGFGSILSELTSIGRDSLIGLPDDLKKILGLLRIGEAFSLLVGTVTVKFMMNGFNGGRIRRFGHK